MLESFDFDEFLRTQIIIPTVENIVKPLQNLYQPLSKTYEKDLMKNYLSFNMLTQQHIDVYNQFIKKAANIICTKVIDMDDDRTIHFENLKFEKPYYQVKNIKRKLTPMYARRHYMTYDSEWTVDLVIKKNNKVIYTSKNRVVIAKIPVMLFSNLCHLEFKSASELIELGEDPIEQGGYFIIVGVEKILMLEEKLSTNRIFIMNSSPKIKDYKTAMRLTSNTSKGTFLNEIVFKINNVMKYSFQSLRKKSELSKKVQFEKTKKLNVIYLFQLFSQIYLNNKYCNTPDDIINLIMPFLKDKKNINHLYNTIAATSAINVGQKKPIGAKQIILKKMNVGTLSDKEKIIEIKKLLKDVFDHLEEIDQYENESEHDYEIRIVKSKVHLLAMMIAMYLNYLNGFSAMDDRDDWANKRLEGPGRKMEQLLRVSWNKVLKEITDKVLRDQMVNSEIEKHFQSGNISSTITKIFKDSFINSKWGIKGSKQKNNATQTLVRDNMLATLSHINTINVNIQRTDKNIAIRMVQLSQYRYVSYVESPDGSNCPDYETIIFTVDGGEKMIKDLKNGDEVITINPITLQQSVSKIHSHFIKSTEEYGKPVLKITSINGRTIICTDDHPFLTQKGWVYAKDLNIEKDLIVIYPSIRPIVHNPEKKLILDVYMIKEKLNNFGMSEKCIDRHIKELENRNLLPLYTDDERLPILARIAGFMLADGCLTFNEYSFNSSYCFGTEYDLQLFQEDMLLLGYNKNASRYQVSTIIDKHTKREAIHHAWVTSYGSSFASLLAALDLTYGKRVNKPSNPVPDWIMSNSLAVKREFLAGFQGGDGSKVNWMKRKDKPKACSISFGHTIQHKVSEHVDSLVFFMNQLKSIFEELEVEILSIKIWDKEDNKKMVELNISSTQENIMKYMDVIGYRYATTKSTHSYRVSEYFRYKQNKIQERENLKEIVIKMSQEGIRNYIIAHKLGIRARLVSSILEYNQLTKNIHTLAPKDCMGYEQWVEDTVAKNNCIFMPIGKIEPAEHCMVADFTTVSDNHSFIANGFVTHNCGLVKNLAITTRLSLDRGIEGDRIITNLINFTDERTIDNQHILMLNSKYLGWCDGPQIRTLLIEARRRGDIYYDTSLFIDDQYLWIDASPSRLLAPVLIVDEDQRLILDVKGITDLTPENLIREGAMEYISAWEEQNLKIAMDIEHLYKRKEKLDEILEKSIVAEQELQDYIDEFGEEESERYNLLVDTVALLRLQKQKFNNNKPFTHCEMSGRAALGVAADIIPFMQHNQAPRNIYQSAMGKQAVSNPHINHIGRYDGTIKVLEAGTPPIVKTQMYDVLGLSERGMGQNVIVAFAALPDTEEDSFIFNQGSIDRGLFRMTKYFNVQGKVKISDPNVKSYFKKPTKLKPNEDPSIYENLNEHGIPIIGSMINEKQAVIGIVKEKNGIEYNKSIYLIEGEKGIVDDVLFHETPTYEIINVKLRITRTPKTGWKFAARSAQKGTIGKIVPQEDMMFEESTGITPDIIVNTTVIPSRMTVSYLMELITGKAAAMYGETVDASAFQQVDMDKYKEMLKHIGFNTEGYSKMRDGVTGELIDTEIYNGVVYFTALKHQPEDKINARSIGLMSSVTRQSVKGRTQGGGLRFGAMEVDTLIGHGASGAVNERLCGVSDKYKISICKPCGETTVYNEIEKKFYCPICETSDAAALTIPYVLKYKSHLLAAFGIRLGKVVGRKNIVEEEDEEKEKDEDESSEEEFGITEESEEEEVENEAEDEISE